MSSVAAFFANDGYSSCNRLARNVQAHAYEPKRRAWLLRAQSGNLRHTDKRINIGTYYFFKFLGRCSRAGKTHGLQFVFDAGQFQHSPHFLADLMQHRARRLAGASRPNGPARS